MDLSNDEMLAILANSMQVLKEEVGPELSVARIITLLEVLRNPGMQQTDLNNGVVGLSQQGVSRAVMALRGMGGAKDKYPALIDSNPDPAYTRRSLLTPTREAGALLTKLTNKTNKMLARKRAAN